MTSFTPGPGSERLYRDALGRFATGVTVVTAHGPNGPCGITANSFSSLSLNPPLVMWALDRDSDRFDVFAQARHSAIHVLGNHQTDTALSFARSAQAFAKMDWQENDESVPLLSHCLSRFECETMAAHEGGDHVILVLRVLRATIGEGNPLVFSDGGFGSVASGI